MMPKIRVTVEFIREDGSGANGVSTFILAPGATWEDTKQGVAVHAINATIKLLAHQGFGDGPIEVEE